MGVCGEKTAKDLGIDRQTSDDFAVRSYERTIESAKKGLFNFEITPVNLGEKDGIVINLDINILAKKNLLLPSLNNLRNKK